jgi:hypothetical protein
MQNAGKRGDILMLRRGCFSWLSPSADCMHTFIDCNKLYVCRHSVFVCLTEYSLEVLAFVIDNQRVYCKVRNKCVYRQFFKLASGLKH